nr:hypothetical protein [Tanacetum cinerariifolium]
FTDHAGNAVSSVSDVAAEFAMMGISSKAKIEKKEWEVKLVESLDKFDKWKVSSKNLVKLINSSMSSRTKLGLGFKETIGLDEVFNLSIPSVFDLKPENREVKSLYEWFVKAGELREVPPPITGTFMPTSYKSNLEETQETFGLKSNTSSINTSESNDFVSFDNSDKSSESKTSDFASCVSRPKTNDSSSTIDVKILPKYNVKDPSPTNVIPSCSFNENVKPPRNLLASPEQTAIDQMMLFHDPAVFDVPPDCSCWFPHFYWFLVAAVWLFVVVVIPSFRYSRMGTIQLSSSSFTLSVISFSVTDLVCMTLAKTSFASFEKLGKLDRRHIFFPAMRSPAMSALYSTSLLVGLNSDLNAYVYSFPFGFTNISPAPEPLELEASSLRVLIFLVLPRLALSAVTENLYWVHLEISSKLPCGVHEGKYEFSNSGYFCYAPCSVRLTKYMRACFFSLFAINTVLTFLFEAARHLGNTSVGIFKELLLPPTLLLKCGQLRFFLRPGFSSFVLPVLFHAKTSACTLRRSRNCIFILVGNFLPMVTFYSSSMLCGESDLTIMNVSAFVIVRRPSPIVTSNGISPNGHDSSPEKPTREYLVLSLGQLGPGSHGGRSNVLATLSMKYATVCEGRGYVPSLWEIFEASPIGDFPLEIAEGSPPSTFVVSFDPAFPSVLVSSTPTTFSLLLWTLGDAAQSGGVTALTGSGLGSISLSDSKVSYLPSIKVRLITGMRLVENASKSLNKLIDSQIADNYKKGLGYNAVLPPYTGLCMLPKPDVPYIGLEEFTSKPAVETLNAKTSEEVPKVVKKDNGSPIIKDWKSDDEDETVPHPKIEKKSPT